MQDWKYEYIGDAMMFWIYDHMGFFVLSVPTKDVALSIVGRANSLNYANKALREENAALRAAVQEMARMLPVLERLNESYPTIFSEACGNAVENPTIIPYRQTLENALAKMKM